VHLASLQEYLERKGHPCFVINLGKNKKLQSRKVVSPKTSLGVARHLLKRRDHVCHLHFGGALHPRILLLAFFAGIVFRRKCTATIHSGGLPVWGIPANPLKKALLRISFAQSRAIICVNQRIAGYFKDLGLSEEKIHTVSPFVFPADKGADQLPPFLESFLEGKHPLLCSIGLLEPEYDLPLLLRAFRRYSGRRPDAGLVIVGSGSLHSLLAQQIPDMGLTDKVFLTGDLEHTQTLRVLSASDCYIRATRYDGDCISLREAIHLGIHSIATDTGFRPEGTVLFPMGNEDQLLDRMLAIPLSTAGNPRGTISGISHDHLERIESILSGSQHAAVPPAAHIPGL
jgi:glycosyltransferase involved in cell wall biosynthesis